MLADSIAEGPVVWTEPQKREILGQVERLLASSYFSHSKRFPTFLRFVVEHVLAGQSDALKERTLGIEIFGRSPDYDTAADPIVRVTAAEIRKRIAQYYQEQGREDEVRISLPPGSYVPQFQWHQTVTEPDTTSVSPLTTHETVANLPKEPIQRAQSRWWIAGVAVVLMAVVSGVLWRTAQGSPLDFFWEPVLNSSDPVLFCVADQNQYSVIALRDAVDPTRQTVLKDNLSVVVIDDLSAIVKIAGLMQAHSKKYSVRGEGVTAMNDLRNGPTVFIGAFDNAWTLRLTQPLRFHFGNNPEMTRFWIADANDQQGPKWVVDRTQQETTNNYRDYGIVARFTDANTGKLAIVVAGVASGGTIAAGEFLTVPAYLEELAKAAPKGSGSKNMEIVLSTQVIGGQPGTPKIEATYFW